MLKKIALLLLTFLFLLFPQSALAQEQFLIDSFVTYTFVSKGKAQVSQEITLENVYSDIYATSYNLNLQNMTLNNPTAVSGTKSLTVTQTEENGGTNLKISFDDAPPGKGKKYSFTVKFEVSDLATRTGEVWEVSVPKTASEAYRSYQTRVLIPKSFGNEAYINPSPSSRSVQGDLFVYDFERNDLNKNGVTAAFGEFQVFSFTLNYHLENPLNRTSLTEITLPPDTAFQKMHYQVLKPAPEEVRSDKDGNWIATYKIKPRERLDINAQGSVQIYATPRKLNIPGLGKPQDYLGETEYWQVNDPKIRALALELKTPRQIYDYVRLNLQYDYKRVKPNVERKGALGALADPTSAICMEFTDLFIALARAAGIPAREINGYAYTENPELQPLSLVADVLHAWPEYWDSDREVWVPVDPTWGSTTGGIDYFDNLDLRHFTFVIHGESATKPFAPGSYKLGQNPQKDVFVNFGQLPTIRQSTPQITIAKLKTIPLYQTKYAVTVKNPGPTALYDLSPEVSFDSNVYQNYRVEFLPPYSQHTQEVVIPFSLFAQNMPDQIGVRVAGARMVLSTNRPIAIIYNLAAVFAVIILVLLAILTKTYKTKVHSIAERIRNKFNHVRKNPKTPQDGGGFS